MKRVEKLLFLGLIFISAFFCFYKLSYPEIQRWDEETNANVIYESLNSENPLVLKLNKETFFEKPPLWYYLTMAVVKVGEFDKFNLRLVSAVSGFLLIMLVYKIGKDFYSRWVGLFSAFLMCTIGQLFFFNPGEFFSTHHIRSADLDILQIFFMTLSFYSFYLVLKKNVNWIYPGTIFAALAIMAKGPLGICPIFVFLLITVFNKEKVKFEKKKLLLSFFLFLSIILPWHFFMYVLYRQEFVDQYLIYHILKRGLTTLEGHHEPWWFYLKVITTREVFLWPELLLSTLLFFFSKRKKAFNLENSFIIITISMLLIVINISQTRLAWYILPLYPFLTLLIGSFLHFLYKEKSWQGVWKKRVGLLTMIILILSGVFCNSWKILKITENKIQIPLEKQLIDSKI